MGSTRRWNRRLTRSLVATALVAAAVVGTAGAAAAGLLPSAIKLTATPSTASVGQPVTLKATVSVLGLGGLAVTPSGSVSFSSTNGTTTVALGSAMIPTCLLKIIPCTATLKTTNLPVGTATVTATYGGDALVGGSARSIQVTVLGAPNAPIDLQATPGDARVSLSWSAPTSGPPATAYNLYRSTNAGSQGDAIATGVAATEYVDNSVSNFTTYYYRVTALNGAGESAPSNQATATPALPSSTTVTCPAGTTCDAGVAGSPDGSTTIQTVAESSAASQTVTQSVGGTTDLPCTNTQGFAGVIAAFQSTAPDAAKTVDYTAFGSGASVANAFYAAHTDRAGCYGSPVQFDGWFPTPSSAAVQPASAADWVNGPFTYGPVPFSSGDGLFVGFLGSCANHGGYQPCFTNIFAPFVPSNTTRVQVPPSALDPKISH